MGKPRKEPEGRITPKSVPDRRNVKSRSDAAADAHERPKDYLNEAEIAELLQAAKQGRHGIRDHLLILMTYRHGRLIAEPGFERCGVGDGRLTIAEEGADLGAMAFGRPAREVQRMVFRRRDVDLPRDLADRRPVDLRGVRGEPAVLAEEQQQDSEAQPAGPALGRDQDVIGCRQRPPFGGV